MVLRGAVIGYGFISSQGHIPAYLRRAQTSKDVEIVAVADICQGRRDLVANLLPLARVYSSAEELLEQESKNLDFVDISTPPCDHARIAKAALALGLHVLCEKPLTVSVEESRSLLRAAETAQRVLFPCHNYKHAPVVKTIRGLIDDNKIGRVRSVTLNTFRNTHAKGVTEWNTHWRRDHKISGGGIAMDHGSHTFYLTFDWLGGYPTSISARTANYQAGTYDTEDNISAVLTFPAGLAHVHLTWTAGVRKVIYTVQGEHGAITVNDDALELAVMRRTSGPDVAQGAVAWDTETTSIASNWMDASHVAWFNSLFDQFRTAIEKGEWVGREAREANLCIELISAAYQSAAQGGTEVVLSPYNL